MNKEWLLEALTKVKPRSIPLDYYTARNLLYADSNEGIIENVRQWANEHDIIAVHDKKRGRWTFINK